MDFLVFLVILFVAIVVFGGIAVFVTTSNRRKEIDGVISQIPGFTASAQYVGADGGSGIALDEERSLVCLLSRSDVGITHRLVGYRDILSAELFEDGHTVVKTARANQVGGVLVGGLLLGGAGAVIGGLSGKKVETGSVNRIELRLVVNDSAAPTHDVVFLAATSKRDSVLYKSAADDARKWQARVDVLIKAADEELQGKSDVRQSVTSVSDELRKLAELRDTGILTDSEFESQKARLLG